MVLVLHHFLLVLQDNTPIDQLAGLTAAAVQVGARDWVAPGERHRPGLHDQAPAAGKTGRGGAKREAGGDLFGCFCGISLGQAARFFQKIPESLTDLLRPHPLFQKVPESLGEKQSPVQVDDIPFGLLGASEAFRFCRRLLPGSNFLVCDLQRGALKWRTLNCRLRSQ